MTLREEAAVISPEIAELRHAIHREPEIGYRPAQDAAEGARRAGRATAGDHPGPGSSRSVTAVLRGGRPGPVVLLRGDMDALPVTEATGRRLPRGSTA